ncbi:hypothetical protein HDU81_000496 [Chytriomyces hyalinus]|nr:hypothetical protein HDU81_008420 [Chytriomyces hyalinus]KAJ3241446.1 hypothetical protein HDU81_000496 [Chytriomyces hyalinus]
MALYSVQQQYCLHFLHAHQENSRILKKQLQTHQKQAQLGLLASQMMTHMTVKAVSAPIPSTRSPPCSPPIAVGGLPSFNAISAVNTQAHSIQPSMFTQSTSRHRDSKVVRYAPYAAPNPASSSSSVLRRASNNSAKPINSSSEFVNTPPLSPLHQIDSKQSQRPPSPPQSIRTTSAESIQIQKIVMTALSTLRLPSHTIIMALFFVHKMLSAALPATHPTSSFFPSISQIEPSTTATAATAAATDFAQCPVALFTAGLILADSMLCDAPVSISTWSWILSQSSPPYSAMAQKLHSTYARDLKRWALNLLDFDLNVSVELYADWVAGVKRFLNGQDALQKLHRQVKLQQQQLLQLSLGANLNLYSFY